MTLPWPRASGELRASSPKPHTIGMPPYESSKHFISSYESSLWLLARAAPSHSPGPRLVELTSRGPACRGEQVIPLGGRPAEAHSGRTSRRTSVRLDVLGTRT